MIADLNTIPKVFSECNKKYFNHELKTPRFGVLHSFNTCAKFGYRKGTKNPKLATISISDYYDYNEDEFESLMVHEMIHYYLAFTGKDTKVTHGTKFMEMAERLNNEYGLKVDKKVDASKFKRTENAPKYKGLMKFFFD